MKPTQICSIDGCTRTARCRTWCGTHHERWRRTGTTDLIRPSTEDRFWSKVAPTGFCWEWTGARSNTGYGHFFVDGGRAEPKTRGAHRVAWELLIGPIPEGLVLDHLCRNRGCVNPDHLEPVTDQVNMRRGKSPNAVSASTNVCRRGHSLEDAYLAHRSDGRITRRCRTCQRERATRGQGITTV